MYIHFVQVPVSRRHFVAASRAPGFVSLRLPSPPFPPGVRGSVSVPFILYLFQVPVGDSSHSPGFLSLEVVWKYFFLLATSRITFLTSVA